MLVTIIAILIVVSIASVLTQRFKFKQEISILITFLSITLFLYLTGLVNLMKYAVYIIYFIALCSFIYTIFNLIKKKIKIKEILTPAVVIYVFVIMIMVTIVRNTYYIEWDEFSHWGANLKAMVQYDLFWSNNIYDGVHVVYSPLAGIVEYFFCKINGGFAEDISYMAINTFIITLLLPILKNLKWNVKDILKGIMFWIAIYFAIILFNFSISSIYIDLLLGIIFTVGMYLAFKMDTKEDKIALIMILIILPILKDTGILFLGIILMQLFFSKIILKIIEQKKATKKEFKKLGVLILIFVISMGLYASWKLYCSSNERYLDDRHDKNAIAQIDIKEYIKAVTLFKIEDGKLEDISTNFYNALNTLVIAGNEDFNIGTVVKLTVILDIIGVLLYLLEKKEKDKKNILILWLSINIGLVLYSLLLLATFMFAFTEEEGRRLASYPRYMGTYFISWVIIAISIGIQKVKKEGLIVAIIAILLLMYPLNITKAVNLTYRKNLSGVHPMISEKSQVIKDKVNLNDKVYLIYQNIGGGLEYHILRYSISPIRTNLMYEWSLGPKYNDEDIWSYDISKEEFEKKLIDEEFNYVFIAQIDKQFIDIYGDLINPDLKNSDYTQLTNKLLKVDKIDDNHIKLIICN